MLEQPDVSQTIGRDEIKQNVFNIFLQRGIRNPSELDFFFQEYLGVTIPKKQICSNHSSPFQIICDLYFKEPSAAMWISSRGSGKTKTSALLDTVRLLTKPKYKIIHSAAIEKQTLQAYEYFLQSHHDQSVKDQLDGEPTQSKTIFQNGSGLSLITMTMQGTNSPHVPCLVIDEVELIRDWQVLQEAICIPQSDDDYRAQLLFLSTRKWHNGIVSRIVEESDKRRIKIYESCIFEVLEKCTRQCQNDIVYGNCPAFKYCNGTAHICEGFYKIDDFIEKVLQLDDETLDAQYFCKKPVGFSGGAVYELFKGVHIVSWETFQRLTGYDRPPAEWKRISGVDFESQFCYNMAAIEPMTGRRWVYAEHYWDNRIKRMLTFAEHADKIQDLPGWTHKAKAWADPSGKQEIFELNRNGVPTEKSPKMAIRTGVDEVRRLLRVNDVLKTPLLLFIEEEVPNTIKSMEEWAFFRNPDGTIDYDNYSDENDHGADCVRYMCYGHHTRSHTTPQKARGLY